MLARSFIEGMLWVYAYYYQGVCSWKWFFPYYYAPLNCDLVDLPTMAPFHFELGLPNTPLEQLLGVLPAASAKLLPVPLQRLMTDPYSPIIDFYPTSFEIDMNGKKNAWEGIAMIPFVDARRLNTALNSLDLRGVLSAREFTRNQFGDELLFVYAPDNEKETIQSTMPRTFPTLVRAQSRMSVFQCPAIPPPGRFVPKLCDGVLQPFAGFPSLTQPSMHVTGQLAKIAVNVFGRASGKETLLIAVGDSDAAAVLGVSSGADTEKALASAADRLGALEEIPMNVGSLYPARSESWRRARLSFAIGARAARRWLGGVHAPNQAAGATCFVQWPIVREAMVTRISTLSGHLFSLHEKYPVYNMPADDVARFAADADAEQERARTTRGVDIGPVYAMAHVRVLRGMRRAADGSIRRYFGEDGDDEEVVPLQLILPERPARPDPRFIDLRPTSMRDAFSLGAEVIYIGGERPELYGSVGQVTGYSADDESRALSVRMTGQAPEPAFGAQIARSVRETMRYYPAYQCARRLGITAQTLGKLTSSIFVQPARIDIGLNLKLQKQNLLVPGYARRSNLPQAWEELTGARTNPMTADSENTDALGGWDYSEATIALIEQYRAKYPRVFELLETYPNEYSYSCDALVSTNGDSDEEDEVTAKGSDEEDDETERAVIASPTRSRQSRSVRGKNRAAAISAWLKTLPSARLMLIPGSSSILPLEACDAIEKAADAYKQKEVEAKPDVDMDNVPMVYLYRTTPVVHWSPSETGSFTLGDRVAALRSDTGVAFGARGVCVGIHHLDSTHSNVYAGVAQSQRGLLLEVLWDEAVLSGTTLNGRCSERRGTFALPADVLNLSRPRVPMVRQAPNANAPSSVADVQRSYAQHQQKHQPKQQQQQKAAQQVKIAARPTSAAVPFAAVVNGASASAPVAAEAETPVESKEQQNKNQKQSKQKQPAAQQQSQQPVKIAARPSSSVAAPVADSESTPDAPPPLAAAKPVSLPTVPPLLADMLAKAKAAAAQNSQNDVSGMLKAMLKISESAPVASAAAAAAPAAAPAQTQPAQNQQQIPQNYPSQPRQPQQMPGYPAMPFPPQMMYGSPYPHPQFMPPQAMYPPQPMPGYSPFAAAAEPGQNAHAAVLNALPQGVRQQMEREMRGGK
jgi:5'-3' exoribonuclease 1